MSNTREIQDYSNTESEMVTDSEDNEPPIVTTPRRKVGSPRAFNLTPCLGVKERAHKISKLKALFAVVEHELYLLETREQ